jgi:hypothetical protein
MTVAKWTPWSAVFQQDGETKLNIDYGHEGTATIARVQKHVQAIL